MRHLHKHLLKQQQNAAAEAEAAVPEETETADLTVYYDHAFAWEERAEAVAETVKRLDLADGEIDADGGYTIEMYASYYSNPVDEQGTPVPAKHYRGMFFSCMKDRSTVSTAQYLPENSAAHFTPELSPETVAILAEESEGPLTLPISIDTPSGSVYQAINITLTDN